VSKSPDDAKDEPEIRSASAARAAVEAAEAEAAAAASGAAKSSESSADSDPDAAPSESAAAEPDSDAAPSESVAAESTADAASSESAAPEPDSDAAPSESAAAESEADAASKESAAAEPDSDAAPSESAAAESNSEVVIELKDLRIAVPGRVLLEDVNLSVRRGERVLLVGPSGSGKSVLLRLLTGLLPLEPFEISGEARIHGHSVLPGAREVEQARREVGIVFQDHALLDELTAGDNLRFARDHSQSPGAPEACQRALEFLSSHGIDPALAIGSLSGGQRQRVAVTRALARDPALVCYDEPTSALDPRSSLAVSALIKETSEAFGKTALVVTHDYPPFEGVVDRVLFLDAEAKSLREVPWEELDATMLAAEGASAPPPPPKPKGPLPVRLAKKAGGVLGDWLAATPLLLLAALKAVGLGLVPLGAKPRWFLRWVWHYSKIAWAGSAIPYNLIAGVIAGFVATYFTYTFIPRPELTEPLILDDVLPALGFALYRIVVPVLVTLLIAGRTGAALASDFGNRVIHHQTQAMKSLGAPVTVYLGTAALWSSLVGVLVVTTVAFAAAALTSLIVFLVVQPEFTPFYWNQKFWRALQPFQFGLLGKGWGWVLGKLLASAGAVCGVAFWVGTRPKKTTADVSAGITRTVYWGTVLVLLIHFVSAFMEFTRAPIGG
jgi:ABC-type transporter Mla maintaining outer membrane lipid asymmetry ATPase subunit MlaF/ABC-type transporter Mla maintaining outer membrane lipid asymmetry permease subunit MlaE